MKCKDRILRAGLRENSGPPVRQAAVWKICDRSLPPLLLGSGRRRRRRGFLRAAAARAVDARGGAPLGEDVRLLAEAVADGGVEAADDFAGLRDQTAGADGVADVGHSVVGLLRALANDGGEIGRQVGDESGGDVVGDESGGGDGILQVVEEIGGGGKDFAVGVAAEAEIRGESGFRARNGAGGAGDGFEVVPDFREQVIPRCGGGAGGDAGETIPAAGGNVTSPGALPSRPGARCDLQWRLLWTVPEAL